jgi:hypothetical protein
MIIHGGGGTTQPRANSGRPSGTLPSFLTPAECRNLLRYRDGDLARAASSALTRIDLGSSVTADLSQIRADLQHNYSVGEWLAARDAIRYAAEQTVASVRRAFKLADLLADPTGAPKTLGEVVEAMAKASASAAKDAIVSGKAAEYRDRLRGPARNLDSALKAMLTDAFDLSKVEDIERGRREMRALLDDRLPEIEWRIAALKDEAAAASREIGPINEELRAIDETLRTTCQ